MVYVAPRRAEDIDRFQFRKIIALPPQCSCEKMIIMGCNVIDEAVVQLNGEVIYYQPCFCPVPLEPVKC